MYSDLLKIIICCLIFSCHTNDGNNPDKGKVEFQYTGSTVKIYFSDTSQLDLSICEAEKRNDSLLLKISDSSYRYQLNIVKTKGKTSINLNELYGITDSSYKSPIFTPLEQSFALDHDAYDTWTDLTGSLKIKVAVLYRWDELVKDTIEVSGHFNAKVK